MQAKLAFDLMHNNQSPHQEHKHNHDEPKHNHNEHKSHHDHKEKKDAK